MNVKTKCRISKSKNGVNAEVTNIKLSKDSRKSIKSWEKSEKKTEHGLLSICGDTVYDIEAGRWHGPVRSYDFGDMKEDWESAFHEFFGIPEDVLVEIDCFDTGILSFERGIYPKYR